MRKIFVFLFVCWVSVNMVVAQEQVNISRFQGEKITGVDASGAFEITIRQGNETGVTLNIPSDYEKNLVFENRAGKIVIGFQGRIKNHSRSDRFTAEIVCSSLENIELSGACKLIGEGEFTTQGLKLDLSGATKVVVRSIKVNAISKIEMSGASTCELRLTASDVELDISGASKLILFGGADKAKLELSGASKADLGSFVLKTLFVDASGASHAIVNVTEVLNAESSGASHVSYFGTPQLTLKSSGASSIKKE